MMSALIITSRGCRGLPHSSEPVRPVYHMARSSSRSLWFAGETCRGAISRACVQSRPPGRWPTPVGISPFGLDLTVPIAGRVALYGATAAGGLVFSRPFPVPEAHRINFTLEYGGGLLMRIAKSQWIHAGYKVPSFIERVYIASENPGLNGHVFYAGYQRAVRIRRQAPEQSDDWLCRAGRY